MQGIFWSGLGLLVFGVCLCAAGGALDAMPWRAGRKVTRWRAPTIMAFGFVIAVIGLVCICGAALIAAFAGLH